MDRFTLGTSPMMGPFFPALSPLRKLCAWDRHRTVLILGLPISLWAGGCATGPATTSLPPEPSTPPRSISSPAPTTARPNPPPGLKSPVHPISRLARCWFETHSEPAGRQIQHRLYFDLSGPHGLKPYSARDSHGNAFELLPIDRQVSLGPGSVTVRELFALKISPALLIASAPTGLEIEIAGENRNRTVQLPSKFLQHWLDQWITE